MSSPIRVLHLVTSLNVGGIETMLMNYYRSIDRKKVQFDFLINREEEGFFEAEIKKLGGKIFRMPELYPWKFNDYKTELRQFLKEHNEYQIIHLHLEERSYFALKILNNEFSEKYTILHSHNYIPFSLQNFTDLKYPFRLYFLHMIQKSNANKNFAASKKAALWLFKNKEYEFFSNAIDVSKFKNIQPKKSSKTFEIVQIGRIAKQKNIEFSLNIIKNLSDNFHITFAGEGEIKYTEYLKRLAKQLNVENKVTFAGYQKTEDVLKNADLLILPSLYEGLGIVANEAQIAGVKVLASENVPNETDLGGIEFLKLTPTVWTKRIEELSSVNTSFELKNTDLFDINVQAVKLEKFYLQNAKQPL